MIALTQYVIPLKELTYIERKKTERFIRLMSKYRSNLRIEQSEYGTKTKEVAEAVSDVNATY